MIKENRASKYMLYAIGEIVLVVIGILIALSINNWNGQRKLNKQEHYILQQLQNEFKADSSKLDRFITLVDQKVKAAKQILVIIDSKNAEGLNLYPVFYSGKAIPFYDYSPTFNELVSSGNLNIISNDSIKNAINDFVNHNAMVETSLYPDLFENKKNYMNHIYNYFNGEINGLLWESTPNDLTKLEALGANYEGFINDPETKYHINKMLASDSEMNFIYKANVKRLLNDVLTLLNKELIEYD
jgi:Family of unknown function (DUF6090)